MTQLTSQEQSQIRFHVGQVFHPDLYLEDVLSRDYNSVELNYIQSAIASCESAYSETTLNGGSLVEQERVDLDTTASKQSTIVFEDKNYDLATTEKDGSKVTVRQIRPSYQQRISAYHREVENLVKILELWLSNGL